MSDLKLEINYRVRKDDLRNKFYLEVMDTLTKNTVKYYYQLVDDTYMANMPDAVLLGSFNQLCKEVNRRGLWPEGKEREI